MNDILLYLISPDFLMHVRVEWGGFAAQEGGSGTVEDGVEREETTGAGAGKAATQLGRGTWDWDAERKMVSNSRTRLVKEMKAP